MPGIYQWAQEENEKEDEVESGGGTKPGGCEQEWERLSVADNKNAPGM